MKLIVTGRHLAIPDAVRQQIAARLRRVDRLLDGRAVSAQCIVWQERLVFFCELTVHAPGDHLLHGLGRARDVEAAVVAAMARVERQAQRLVDRWKTRRRSSRRGEERRRPARGTSLRAAPRVVRSSAHDVKPMRLEDALLALADAAQPFLVFRDAASDRIAVLYRRPDGNVGLIEPEV